MFKENRLLNYWGSDGRWYADPVTTSSSGNTYVGSTTPTTTSSSSSGSSSSGSSSSGTQSNGTYTYVPTPTVSLTSTNGSSGSSGGGSSPASTGSSGTVLASQSTAAPAVSATAATDKAMQTLLNSPSYQGLSTDQQAMLRMVVQNWDPTTEINMSNVLTEFDKIKTSTIDPYFAEQVSTFSKNVQNQYDSMQQARTQELESQQYTADKNIRDTQAGLESSGMTFSGQGAKTLGAQSQYGSIAGEGTVPQVNRLMASSTALDYQNRINNLGVSAEQSLGADGLNGIVPGYTPLGVTTGSIAQNKTQQLGSTLSSLANQNQNLNSYKEPVDFTAFNNALK